MKFWTLPKWGVANSAQMVCDKVLYGCGYAPTCDDSVLLLRKLRELGSLCELP